MSIHKLVILFLILIFCSWIECYFTLVGSRTIVFGEDYEVYLTRSHEAPSKTNLLLELEGKTSGEVNDYTIPLDFQEKLIKFELAQHHTIENFTLTLKIPKTSYSQSVDIFVIAKTCSVLVQTDKAVYKPGDKVQFRVLVLDGNAKPYNFIDLHLTIVDAHGVIVFDNNIDPLQSLFPGVVGGEYEISDTPPLGKWNFNVKIDASKTIKSFEVTEYVLPRFSVEIICDSHVLLSNGNFKVTMFGEYTFGEFVAANAMVSVQFFDRDNPDVIKSQKMKLASVSAKKVITFDLVKELKIVSSGTLKIDVTLDEKSTGKKVSASRLIEVHESENHNIELIRSEHKFKPGFHYSLKAIVTKFDGAIETNQANRINFNITYFLPSLKQVVGRKMNHLNSYVNEDKPLTSGIADLTIDVPKNVVAMIITAKYLNAEASVNVTRHSSKSRDFLKVEVPNKKYLIGESITVTVQSTKMLDSIYYIAVGKSRSINKKIQMPRKGNEFEFDLKVEEDFSPSMNIAVYYVHEFGEVIFDELDVEVDDELRNNLDIKLSKKVLSPGGKSRINLSTSSNAFVGLLAIDKRTLLHRTGNDITKERVFSDLLQFNPSFHYGPVEVNGTASDYTEFGGKNAFILTDATGDIQTLDLRFDSNEGDYSDYDLDDIFGSLDEETKPAEVRPAKVRKNFPETWIFETFTVDENGEFNFDKTVPDTITSWIITGFSIDPETGLGLSKPQTLYVKQDFFIKLNLPYSIRIGEILKVDISIFNYVSERKTNMPVDVTLKSDSKFKIIDKVSKCKYEPIEQDESEKVISVAPNSVTTTYFYIKPLEAGKIMLSVKAVGKQAQVSDEILKELLVEYEGLTHYGNNPILVDLTSQHQLDPFHSDLQIDEAIPKSVKIGVSVFGDLLGPSLSEISNLIHLPSGCGEQRLVKFVPTILATKYLQSVGKLTAEHKANSVKYIKTGYHQILETKNYDGSFNIWGYEKSDSIWLTAYIMKCLCNVKNLTSVNDEHIYEGLAFLQSKQKLTGSFSEYGPISHRRVQGGLSGEVPLSAYVTISFLECADYNKDYQSTINKSLNFIDNNLSKLQDNYGLAIATYALVLGKHSSVQLYLNALKRNSIVEEDKMYWKKDLNESISEADSNLSIEVEIAAYALLAFLKSDNNDKSIGLSIMNWLISKRNSEGGFYSTQDTVIGLQALTEIANIYHSPDVNMNIRISANDDVKELKINNANSFTLQNFDLPSKSRYFSVTANGTGRALINIWHSYSFKNALNISKAFNLSLKLIASRNGGIIYLTTCVSYIIGESSMAVVEINLPSGFVYDSDTTPLLKEFNVKKVETKDSKTTVILYFDKVTTQKVCPEIRAIREQIVDQLKSSTVRVYEYYEPEKRSIEYFTIAGPQECQ